MAIYEIFKSDFPPVQKAALLLALFFVFLFAFPIHEYAHARVAYALGDKTAYYNGRMTINPLAHIDPFGFVLMAVCGFGWAKGVPINPNNFENRKKGMALSALAGPVSNILMAFIATFLSVAVFKLETVIESGNVIMELLFWIFYIFALNNISLAIFNFIPIPPLDGSKIIYSILPDKYYYKLLSLDRYSFYLLILLFFVLNNTNFSIGSIVSPIFEAFYSLWFKVFF